VSGIGDILAGFREATGCEAAVWVADGDAERPRVLASTRRGSPPPVAWLPGPDAAPLAWTTEGVPSLVTAVPGPRPAWLMIGHPEEDEAAEGYLAYLIPVVAHALQAALEVEHAASELAERYEEINLLYTISEILGRTVSLDEATATILGELSETVGARLASILVYDAPRNELQPIAAIGADPGELPPVPCGDACSVAARVFATRHPVIAPPSTAICPADVPYRRGELLSVPILWTGPRGGSERLGIVNLSARGSAFTAGDLKLVAAIASQIGTAIQNARLVRASIDQQRLQREMQLANELQLKLLPPASAAEPVARAAARVIPAESVGGDFYYLARLDDDRVGVMIGDVSGHGYQAALIMALTLSAAAIHARTTNHPGEMLGALLESVRDELESTEMYVSAFYAVIDRASGTLRYANAGHPHAFVLSGSGAFDRLPAIDPPLGMGDTMHTAERPWDVGSDALILFTDGITDARNPDGGRLGEDAVLEAVAGAPSREPQAIVDAVFAVLDEHVADAPLRDDLTLVALRT
jgi:sigma-B regulation protein RsbU (phosphoserine phosphatase)